MSAVKKDSITYCLVQKDEDCCCEVDSKAILIQPYNKSHVLPVVAMLNILAKGYTYRNEDAEMVVEAKLREKLYFRGSLDNLHGRVLEEIAH